MRSNHLRVPVPIVVLTAVLATSSGCEHQCERLEGAMGPQEGSGESVEVAVGPMTWVRHTVDAAACGPAFVTVADVDGDARPDLAVSRYGKGAGVPDGEVVVYRADDGLGGGWSREAVLAESDELVFPAETAFHDVDGDGDQDAVVTVGWFICGVVPGTEPCGGLVWFEQTAGGWVRHDLVEPTGEAFFHAPLLTDLDGDGVQDLVTVSETYGGDLGAGVATTQWFGGTGDGQAFATPAHVVGEGLGTIPNLFDIDGDGDMDVYGAQFFMDGASFGWFEQVAAPAGDAGTWSFHAIDDAVGGSIDITMVPDLFGDGLLRAVATNHTNTAEDEAAPGSAVFVYTPGEDVTAPWSRAKISSGIVSGAGTGAFAPGVLGAGDADADGDVDVLVSGDGDPRVFLFEQTEAGSFAQHAVEEEFGQAGGMQIVDLDGDGDGELIVVGYEADAVYVYERQ